MKKKITLQDIERAIKKNCILDKYSLRPLTLKKYEGGNKNKGIGRMLMMYFADRADIEQDEVMGYLDLSWREYEKHWVKMTEYLIKGKNLFELRSTLADEPALYFYRKMRLIEASLSSPL